MFKKIMLFIIVFASVSTASMTSNIHAFAQEGQQPPREQLEDPTQKRFITTQPCDLFPKMLEIVKGYKEDLLFTGEGMSFAASNGQGYMGGMMFFTNQDTGTWSMLQVYGDGTACLVMNGRKFAPYGGPTLQTGIKN